MSYYKAVFDASRPLGVKIPEEREIHSKMSTNPLFPDPPVPYADFLNALDAQDDARQQAEFGGIERTAAKRSRERVVDNMVRKYKAYVTVVADGNTDIILSSGFRHTKPRSSAGDMVKVTGVERFPTGKSGELKLNWDPVDNAGFYQVQGRPLDDSEKPTDSDNPQFDVDNTDDDDWMKQSTRPARIVMEGLEPLTYYAVRVRANGTNGYGPFSDVLVVLVT